MKQGSGGAFAGAVDHEIVIVGAGFSGIGMAIKLAQNGFRNFVILERAEDVGGVWRDNSWPGLAVDAPGFSYCYPFEPNPEFSRRYPPCDEVRAYAEHCVEKYRLRPFIRFGKHVVSASFDKHQTRWNISLKDGSDLSARFLICATNAFGEPKLPDIPGLETFSGRLVHPARWNYEYNPSGDRIAVIGTGATAVQIVPALASQARHLTVYQRTPVWCMPKSDIVFTEEQKKRYRRFPWLIRLERLAGAVAAEKFFGQGVVNFRRKPEIIQGLETALLQILDASVQDEGVRAKLRPTYGLFCKRPVITDDYWPVFNRENVSLVTESIQCITETGIENADGQFTEFDTIVLATGYELYGRYTPVTFDVFGAHGGNLGEDWVSNGFRAYEGVALPRFPNFFMFCGPTSQGGYTYFNMIRNSGRHILRALKRARRRGDNYIEVTEEASDRDYAFLLQSEKNSAILNNNCGKSNSYYVDIHGHVSFLRMSSEIRNVMRSLFSPASDYHTEARPGIGRAT